MVIKGGKGGIKGGKGTKLREGKVVLRVSFCIAPSIWHEVRVFEWSIPRILTL